MKGVVLWANPDRHPLAGATNTNGGRGCQSCLGMSRPKRNALRRSSVIHSFDELLGKCWVLRPRLCEVRKSPWWRLSRPDHCSVLRCLSTVVAEVIRLVSPSCRFFPKPACASKSENLGRLALRLARIKRMLVHPPARLGAFCLARAFL